MEHPFFTTAATRAKALQWLTIAKKLLSARDLLGSKSLATCAREFDPTLTLANEILAVVDTLLAGDRRIENNQLDWYAILQLTPPQGRDSNFIANQHNGLVLLLNLRSSINPTYLTNPYQHCSKTLFYLGVTVRVASLSCRCMAVEVAAALVPTTTREFNSSKSKSRHELVSNQAQESYSRFAGNVGSASGLGQEQLDSKKKESQEIYSNIINKSIHDYVNESENVGEMIEDEEDVERMDLEEARVDSLEDNNECVLGCGDSIATANYA
ncbi:hypothetical protein Salat_0144300 [Sesamum alatum]|uniref:Uncharacterized protein n=1 Tax=Sesamum alatum TaxID=300844 RepID=A0AAE1YXJ6_9LAMI|nr:hypothetical protein Salat_0144300 [Sesamum alatum]